MKLQLNEQELNAYIKEAIRQEINEATQVDFDALDRLVGGPQNKKKGNIGWNRRYFSLNKQKRDLANGTFGKSWLGRTSADVVTVLRDLGYSDEQIRAGIQNGLIRKGKLSDTEGFISYDSLARQNRRDARLHTNAGMRVSDNGNGGQQQVQQQPAPEATEPENYPWSNIPDNQIAWGQNKPVRQQPARTAQTPQPEQSVQPEQPQRQQLPAIQPVQAPANMPGATVSPDKQPGLAIKPVQPSLAQSAVQVMGQTANQSNMGLRDQRNTNMRTSQNALNAIDQMQKSGAMTRQQAQADKNLVKTAEKALR